MGSCCRHQSMGSGVLATCLFSAVLNQRTLPSGHSQRRQKNESIATDAAKLAAAAQPPTSKARCKDV